MSLDFHSNSNATELSCYVNDKMMIGMTWWVIWKEWGSVHHSPSRITDHYGDLMQTNIWQKRVNKWLHLYGVWAHIRKPMCCVVLCYVLLRVVARICILWIGAVSRMLYKHCLRISIFTADKLYMYSIVNLSCWAAASLLDSFWQHSRPITIEQ